MNTDTGESHPHESLTRRVIGAAFEVSNTLGCGFLEKVYENALTSELRSHGLSVAQQVPIRVVYKAETVGEYVADVIVEGAVLVEAKATPQDHPVYLAQTLNYLKATKLPVGLVLNFGQPRLSIRRVVLSHDHARQQPGIDVITQEPKNEPA